MQISGATQAPPQSGWHSQVQAVVLGVVLAGQLRDALSHTQSHAVMSKRSPAPQVAFCKHMQPQVASLQVSNPLQLPPQSAVHSYAQVCGLHR